MNGDGLSEHHRAEAEKEIRVIEEKIGELIAECGMRNSEFKKLSEAEGREVAKKMMRVTEISGE